MYINYSVYLIHVVDLYQVEFESPSHITISQLNTSLLSCSMENTALEVWY